MLDVNNDNLSSESAEGSSNIENEKSPVKPQNTEQEKDDSKDEDVAEKTQVTEAEKVVKEDDVVSSEKEEVKEVVEESKEAVADTSVEEVSIDEAKEEVKETSSEEADDSAAGGTEEDAPAVKNKEIPEFDLSTMSMDDIVKMMNNLLVGFEIKDIKNQIESLKIDFQKKFSTFVKEQKEAFLKSGGEEADFFLSAPIKHKFDELMSDYKRKRQYFYKEVERTQKENLELKQALIDELKELINNAEASTMYKNFRVLQERWREVGQIPHAKYNDVWRTYHHHVERFYDLLHLNNDFRDLDFRHNLEEKSKLIKKAEVLAEEEDVNHAFKELQILHRMWKEDIGPVARELREEVWHKFSEATKKIHKKRHDFQDQLEEKFKANVGLKLSVIEKIKGLDISANSSHKDWQQSIKKLEALRDEFFAIGRVPKSKNEEVWQLFRDATRKFNSEKNSFYKGIKNDQAENLKKKLLLVEQAESLKESEDWGMATEVFKKVQAEWKKIGHVPRRDSDKIWKRFKDACNHYFDRLHEKQNDLDKGQSEIIEKKKDFMDALKKEIEAGKELSMEFVQKGLEDWRALGVLPQKVKHLDIKFNKLLDTAYKKLNIDKDEATFLRFKSSVDSLLDQRNVRKLDSEQLFIRRKIDEITKEIKQLENNISFISNASADNPLVKNVYKNIEEYKKSLQIWKRKIDYMKKMEY
ncbi:DUF349 domain-containing protein [Lutimonas sp.]|uniref:DUF349 domain-containing protein n=1 Tax=Lutimonas sp. TaxID=1872403 RepID=UPI003D9B8717